MSADSFTPSRGSVYASLATLAWISLPSGIFLVLNDSTALGILLASVAVVFVAIAASGGAVRKLQDRTIAKSRGYFMVFTLAVAALVSALFSFSLFQLTRSSALPGTIHALGIVLLGAWAVVGLLKSIAGRGN
jgi:hypothetical protein